VAPAGGLHANLKITPPPPDLSEILNRFAMHDFCAENSILLSESPSIGCWSAKGLEKPRINQRF
jgi:hypothetical protein